MGRALSTGLVEWTLESTHSLEYPAPRIPLSAPLSYRDFLVPATLHRGLRCHWVMWTGMETSSANSHAPLSSSVSYLPVHILVTSVTSTVGGWVFPSVVPYKKSHVFSTWFHAGGWAGNMTSTYTDFGLRELRHQMRAWSCPGSSWAVKSYMERKFIHRRVPHDTLPGVGWQEHQPSREAVQSGQPEIVPAYTFPTAPGNWKGLTQVSLRIQPDLTESLCPF